MKKKSSHTLVSTFLEIVNYLQITIKNTLPLLDPNISINTQIEQLAKSAGLRVRKVRLNENWATEDAGPLLAFRESDHRPYALISQNGQYPESYRTQVFEQDAFSFYRTFPDVLLNWKDLLIFSKLNIMRDVYRVFKFQVCIGLIGLLIPISTGVILDSVIPFADYSRLAQLLMGLSVAAVASAALGLAQSFGLMRIRFQANIATQAAVWDRLLRLPISFFKQFNAGDLASRARGVDSIQQQITQILLSASITGVFSIITLGLLFYYDAWLALSAVMLVMIAILVNLIFNRLILHYQRPLLTIQGKLSGFLFQILSGIAKLRVANVESSAFSVWSKQFIEKNKLFLKSRTLVNNYNVFHPFFLVISTIILFALVVLRGESLTFGSFIAFYAAYGQFLSATLAMSFAITQSLRIVPLYERITPIITTLPEAEKSEQEILALNGHIELKNISFRYAPDAHLLFENLSLTIKPGQFTAIVGPSGSGKSTLFRLLLGFETPEKGGVFYDDQDLTHCNIRHLRQQLGVVLQQSTLMPGTIFENIVGFNPEIKREEAFEIAKLVDIANDIEAMPMKMDTFILEGGRTLSAGQRQRLMIARAIANKPQILLLDEATSALDNTTQALISKNLTKLSMTRVVAAHRLSTIAGADFIYVLDNGKIVQSGTYEKLSSMPGLFSELMERQKI